MNKSTQQKLKQLKKDLVAKYGEGSLVSRKEILALIKSKPKDTYCSMGYITRNPDHKVTRSQYLITEKDNVVEQAETKRKELEIKESKMLPKTTRNSVKKLAKEMMKEDKPKTKKKKVMKDTDRAYSAVENNTLMNEETGYISQNDIDEAFGGNDINDIMRTL